MRTLAVVVAVLLFLTVASARVHVRRHGSRVAKARTHAISEACVKITAGTSGTTWSDWMDAWETAGGHAKACHVGKSDNGLIGRITDRGGNHGGCPPAAASSSFTIIGTAAAAIGAAIKDNKAGIKVWVDGGCVGNHVIDGVADATIGTVVSAFEGRDTSKNRDPCGTNKSYVCETTKKFKVVLKGNKATCDCFYLLTAYPAN